MNVPEFISFNFTGTGAPGKTVRCAWPLPETGRGACPWGAKQSAGSYQEGGDEGIAPCGEAVSVRGGERNRQGFPREKSEEGS